ncbi:MAG: DUF393 domain-containing protein [Pseudomonadota bacterium]
MTHAEDKNDSVPGQIVIYHDGSCPICRAEMEELQRIDVDEVMTLVDVSVDGFIDAEADSAGLDQRDLMRAFYIRTHDDHWLSGPDAFEHLYLRLGMPRVARFWGSRLWRPFVNFGYRLFAMTRGVLAYFGLAHVVRAMVRREAKHAATRATQCETDR